MAATPQAPSFPEQGRVFTNTRYPELTVLGPNRKWFKFNSTKIVARNEEDAAFLATVRHVYQEPDEFLTVKANDERFFTHRATGFKTMNRDAYDDWVNRSEWGTVRR